MRSPSSARSCVALLDTNYYQIIIDYYLLLLLLLLLLLMLDPLPIIVIIIIIIINLAVAVHEGLAALVFLVLELLALQQLLGLFFFKCI
jgi:hypothetical protein